LRRSGILHAQECAMRQQTAAVALAIAIAIVALASALMVGCAARPQAASQSG